MEMLCASRPTWMWKTQISVAANISASSHQGILNACGASGGLSCRVIQRMVPTTASTATKPRTRRVGRAVRRIGAGSVPRAPAEAFTLTFRRVRALALEGAGQIHEAPGAHSRRSWLTIVAPLVVALVSWPEYACLVVTLITPTLRSTT